MESPCYVAFKAKDKLREPQGATRTMAHQTRENSTNSLNIGNVFDRIWSELVFSANWFESVKSSN